jgi:hypothetical protein
MTPTNPTPYRKTSDQHATGHHRRTHARLGRARGPLRASREPKVDRTATPRTSFPAPHRTTTPQSAIPTSTHARNPRRDNAPESGRRRYRRRQTPDARFSARLTEPLRRDFPANPDFVAVSTPAARQSRASKYPNQASSRDFPHEAPGTRARETSLTKHQARARPSSVRPTLLLRVRQLQEQKSGRRVLNGDKRQACPLRID